MDNVKWSKKIQLECGTMPNVMAALPNIRGALCSTPQNLAEAHSELSMGWVVGPKWEIAKN